MRGYALWVPGSPATANFAGILNNGSSDIQITLTALGGDANSGYNLVGNPFPSALDWDASGWTKYNVDNTIYFWEGVGGISGDGSYHYYVGASGGGGPAPVGLGDATKYIPAMQGFFVHASGPGAVLKVKNKARVHSDQEYYKQSEGISVPLIRLQASNSDQETDETVIRFFKGSGPEHDPDYDAFKMYGQGVPQVYTFTEGSVKLAVTTLPEFNESMVIPVGFQPDGQGEYSFRLTELSAWSPEVEIYLLDRQYNIETRLFPDERYSFLSSGMPQDNRFALKFAIATDEPAPVDPMVLIYSYDKKIIVRTENPEGIVQVYDMLGREIPADAQNRHDGFEINMNTHSGYYVVRYLDENGITVQKVFID